EEAAARRDGGDAQRAAQPLAEKHPQLGAGRAAGGRTLGFHGTSLSCKGLIIASHGPTGDMPSDLLMRRNRRVPGQNQREQGLPGKVFLAGPSSRPKKKPRVGGRAVAGRVEITMREGS